MKQQPKKTTTTVTTARETTVRTTSPVKDPADRTSPGFFARTNFQWMIIGAVVMILGYLLMAGGKSPDPNEFNADEVYSARRITIAPILILVGLVIEVYAIFRTPKTRV